MSNTSQHSCTALLFDMDGTLIDSVPAANRAWGAWARRVGLGDKFALEGAIHGRQRPDVVRHLLPDLPDAEVAVYAEEIRIAERADVEGVTSLPGSLELLAALPTANWAIVTSCDEEVAIARLNAAGLPIPRTLVNADMVPVSKPDPTGFLTAATLLGVSPEECIVFEDAPAGIEAGLAAGMRVIASRYSQESDAALKGAIAFFDNPSRVRVDVTSSGLTVTVDQRQLSQSSGIAIT